VASSVLMQACLNKTPDELPTPEELEALIRPALVKQFKPAFLGRLTVVPFYPIPDDVLAAIIELKLDRIARRVAANHKAAFAYDESLVDAVLARCTEVDSGARNVDNILNGTLLPRIAEAVLARMAEGAAIGRISVGADAQGNFEYAIA
jgi:type VI secretion system protein VasG